MQIPYSATTDITSDPSSRDDTKAIIYCHIFWFKGLLLCDGVLPVLTSIMILCVTPIVIDDGRETERQVEKREKQLLLTIVSDTTLLKEINPSRHKTTTAVASTTTTTTKD